jgi:type II secretory pathway pseudopilin PulG
VIARSSCGDAFPQLDPELLRDDLTQHEVSMRTGTDSGMSLVAVLVGVAILGVVAMGLSEVFKTQFRANKELDLKVARMAVLRHLNYKLHEYCPPPPSSLGWVPASCTPEVYLEIPSSGPAPLIKSYNPTSPSTAQPLGELLLRAKCMQVGASSPKILVVEAIEAKGLATGNPHTKWFNISPKIPLACQINR